MLAQLLCRAILPDPRKLLCGGFRATDRHQAGTAMVSFYRSAWGFRHEGLLMLLDRILVPLDGSASGETALPFLRQLPLRKGAQVFLTKIVHPGAKDPGPGFVEESLMFTEEYLKEVAATLAKDVLPWRRSSGATALPIPWWPWPRKSGRR